ncbi:hypothetical protein AWB81_06862 [Caballeronia arationis]|jgi:hypothetical protein|uniref:DUF4238 domain-containing protein n=1 Tax=Caballeronia arationis TaxID=1777142 RepID=A0A7Z7N0S3_9BURK|nr:hypothetical protein [Caballeronia arationis]SAL04783.1 hypothetical protein AWB81_06862 [Caballeronia arationis]SOE54634.1 hypothetical protein SAMN05446927_0868 [Caballeronia arationis]
MADHDRLHPLRPLLKNWVWEHGRIGTRYLDCVDGIVKFDEGKKSHFAAEKYIYVPLGKDAQDVVSEDGPAIHETGLARFLRAAQLGVPEEAGSAAEVQRAVQDCVELALFSEYQLEAREAFARYEQEPMFEDEIRAAVVDDIRRIYAGKPEQLALCDFSVLYGLPIPLLISETPFIDWRVRASPALPFVSLPLGPYCLLVGAPSGRRSRIGPVVWKAATAMGPLKDHNRRIAERARLWLVATTDDQLVAAQSHIAAARGPRQEDAKR